VSVTLISLLPMLTGPSRTRLGNYPRPTAVSLVRVRSCMQPTFHGHSETIFNMSRTAWISPRHAGVRRADMDDVARVAFGNRLPGARSAPPHLGPPNSIPAPRLTFNV
jgi:hypothetical protein